MRVPYQNGARGTAARAGWGGGFVFISDGTVCSRKTEWRESPQYDALLQTVGASDMYDVVAVLVSRDKARLVADDSMWLMLTRARLAGTHGESVGVRVDDVEKPTLAADGVRLPRKYERLARYRWTVAQTSAGDVVAAFDERGALIAVIERIEDVRD